MEEAGALVNRANALIEKSIREIREKNAAGKEIARTVRAKSRQLRQELAAAGQERDVPAPNPDVAAGTRRLGGRGIGIRCGRSRQYLVGRQIGSRRLRRSQDACPASRPPARPRRPASAGPASSSGLEKPDEVRQDLDMRGMTGDEALPLVDKFIDDAVLSGLHSIDIIHGKGTGALRKKIIDFLGTHSRVKSQRMGEWNEGGFGATVVELTEE